MKYTGRMDTEALSVLSGCRKPRWHHLQAFLLLSLIKRCHTANDAPGPPESSAATPVTVAASNVCISRRIVCVILKKHQHQFIDVLEGPASLNCWFHKLPCLFFLGWAEPASPQLLLPSCLSLSVLTFWYLRSSLTCILLPLPLTYHPICLWPSLQLSHLIL